MLTRKSDYIRANGEGRLDTGVARMRKTTMAQYSARTPIRDLDSPMPSRILRQALRRSKVHVVAARIRHGLPRASHPRQNSSGTDPGPRAPHLRSPAVTVRPTGQHMTALSVNVDYDIEDPALRQALRGSSTTYCVLRTSFIPQSDRRIRCGSELGNTQDMDEGTGR